MSYNYGPPPPAPPPAPPSNSPGGYPSYGPPRGGHAGRGRGGSDRGGYHQPHPGYNYGHGQQPAYGPQNPAPYTGPPQPGYPQPPQQAWHPEHGQQHPPHGAPHAPLPAQNYHPNYAPQIYQQQPAYGGQPQYPPAPQQPYPQAYPNPSPYNAPPNPQWGGHHQPPPPTGHGAYGGGGGGRGGRGGHNDRGGPKGQMMGPPIRIGFDGNQLQTSPAPVSAPYPYAGPPAPPAPYPAPYQGHQPPAPYMPAPPYDGHSGHGSRHGRGGFHQNKSRPHFGGDKNRGRNQNQNKGQATQTPPTQHQKPDAPSAGRKKKRKTNTLGLTPGDDSDEDDENEEQRLNEMYGAEAPNPKSTSEIAAWIAERRARFPTKSRIEARKAAAKTQNGDASHGKADALEQKAEKLRKQLEKVESSIKRKREQQDEGDDMRDIDLSSPSSDVKSDDEKPEVMSTRQEPSNVPPPPRKADPTKHCKYFSTGGTCGKRGKCRFVHDPAVREAALKERELNGGRITLQQRLILNDKDQEDLAIVETLKYLQDKGVIPKKTPAAGATEEQSGETSNAKGEATSAPADAESSNGLPPAPPSIVSSDDNTTKYSGWNLSGFGNTGVRPSE